MQQSDVILIIPHYNNPRGLEESILSIKENIKIDLLIIDDGSEKIFNEEKIESIKPNGKIYFEYLEINKGIGAALNVGLDIAVQLNYEFIARLDCGDFCKPDKFFKQIHYLKLNKNVKLIGTWVNILDNNRNFLFQLKHPVNYNEIKKKMFLNNTFVHPSVVFRSEVLVKTGKYPLKYARASQDYALFFNIIKHFKAENYPEILLDYVTDDHSISTTQRKLQVKNRILIIIDNFYFGFYPIYGLVRNALLFVFSRSLTIKIKKLLKQV